MSDIFISYARSDKQIVKVLAEVLEQQGWSVWWDREIPGGETFADVIIEALDVSKCVVVLWTKASITSHWVQTEASEGLSRKILIPALIEKVKIPFEFRRIHALQLIDWKGQMPHQEVDRLIDAVENILGIPRIVKSETKRVESIKAGDKIPGIISPIFRSTPTANLSESSVISMLKDNGFYDSCSNVSASGFPNDYELKKDGKIVYDQANGLMWQQSGTATHMSDDKAKEYVAGLNSGQFAGYKDWRLPTLEEAMSLMEPTQNDSKLYIESVFDSNQRWIWTSDLYCASRAWVVSFDDGYCGYFDDYFDYDVFVRAVR